MQLCLTLRPSFKVTWSKMAAANQNFIFFHRQSPANNTLKIVPILIYRYVERKKIASANIITFFLFHRQFLVSRQGGALH
jgi:hypothetical protein